MTRRLHKKRGGRLIKANQVISECSKLAQRETIRLDTTGWQGDILGIVQA